MKRWLGVVCVGLLTVGCSRHKDDGSSVGGPIVSNPIAPVCGVVVWNDTNDISLNTLREVRTIPGFDALRGDVVVFRWRKVGAVVWEDYRAGFSPVKFVMVGNVVTITVANASVWYEYAIEARMSGC